MPHTKLSCFAGRGTDMGFRVKVGLILETQKSEAALQVLPFISLKTWKPSQVLELGLFIERLAD
jgi:hypothetical protein